MTTRVVCPCNISQAGSDFELFWHMQCCTQSIHKHTHTCSHTCPKNHTVHQLTISPKCAWLCILWIHPKIGGVGWEVWKVRDYSPFPVRPRTHKHTHSPHSLISHPVSVVIKNKILFCVLRPTHFTLWRSEVHAVSLTSSVAVSHSQVPA